MISVIIAAHELRREIGRTVRSLVPPYQIGLKPADVEIIVLDNGSTEDIDASWFADLDSPVRVLRWPAGNPSPCVALNAGVRAARHPLVAVLIDGARMASPGLLSRALMAGRIADDVFVATMGFHLGPDTQQRSRLNGYCAEVEDRLLAEIDWFADGYRLFEICARGESYRHGVLSDFPETNAFVVRKATFERLGGFHEDFRYRGGGLANFDFYERVLCDAWLTPIVLVGEGTFHQIHDGNTTRAGGVSRRELEGGPTIWEAMAHEFTAITGHLPLTMTLRKPLLFGRCESDAAERLFFASDEVRIAGAAVAP
jgi:glycosyltransferase involved in cell wall biosynthesis